MTKKRVLFCKDKNCPHEKLKKYNDWIRQNLPDSDSGYLVSDLDFVIENWKTKNIMLLEVKTNNVDMAKGQQILFSNIDEWIKKGISDNWTYHGFHLLQFEKTSPDDGKIYFDKNEISKEDLISILQFKTVMQPKKIKGFLD